MHFTQKSISLCVYILHGLKPTCTRIFGPLTDILSPIFSRVRVARSLVSCVVFCSSLYIFSLCPLYCLTFFDLWLLIAALIPSIFSYTFREQFNKQNIRNYVNRFYCWRYDGAKATVWLLVLCRHGQWVHYFRDEGLMGSGLKTWAMMGLWLTGCQCKIDTPNT
jgi:hypothetical protein